MNNLFSSIPTTLDQEIFEDLFKNDTVRIERILSKGHCSGENDWYDQDENEWVVVLKGAGTVVFADDRQVQLNEGDYLNIPAHTKHRVLWTRVLWTDPDVVTVWLAIFYP
ncbi:MAG: cupin domain-containing protein [Deltaproteobacteria bacterium]|nr:cupin domain-containing protein [Deltaproteobacteria bacterium]